MIHTIFNEALSARIDSAGAQLRSLMSAEGTEYLWQGDARYWSDSSPVLFPYIARLYNNSYLFSGETYTMGIHGFAAQYEFTAEKIDDASLRFVLRENDATLRQYPFRFELDITYSLSGAALFVTYNVSNLDDKVMPFALGGHPGFNVPLWPGTKFEDYYLSFDEVCSPCRIGFTEELFVSGEELPYPLEDGRILKLSHSLFDDDAIILKNTAKGVRLGCSKTNKYLDMEFSAFPYFGIWHMPGTQAPYVCLEPWTSLPSRQGVIEDLSKKEDMLSLMPGEEYKVHWSVKISEE